MAKTDKRLINDTSSGKPYRSLGVIGGLGPMATAHFYETIVRMTKADTDQQHIPVYISSRPDTPDRTAHIMDPDQPDPTVYMIEAGRKLIGIGADYLAIPCVTAHHYYSRLQMALPKPLISLTDQTILYLSMRKAQRIGLMATDGTLSGRIFQDACENTGIQCLVPDIETQADIMHLIYSCLKTDRPFGFKEREVFLRAAGSLLSQGAEYVLLGCTELSLASQCCLPETRCINVMSILAAACVQACGATLRDDYHRLIEPGWTGKQSASVPVISASQI